MSITHLPGNPECIAVEVPDNTPVALNRHAGLDVVIWGYPPDYDDGYEYCPPGKWKIVCKASEVIPKLNDLLAKSFTLPPDQKFLINLPSRFRTANLDPEKEFVILRKTN